MPVRRTRGANLGNWNNEKIAAAQEQYSYLKKERRRRQKLSKLIKSQTSCDRNSYVKADNSRRPRKPPPTIAVVGSVSLSPSDDYVRSFGMTFGCHKGKLLKDIPDDYLRWVLSSAKITYLMRAIVVRHLTLKCDASPIE